MNLWRGGIDLNNPKFPGKSDKIPMNYIIPENMYYHEMYRGNRQGSIL
jgi:hypothetical protein